MQVPCHVLTSIITYHKTNDFLRTPPPPTPSPPLLAAVSNERVFTKDSEVYREEVSKNSTPKKILILSFSFHWIQLYGIIYYLIERDLTKAAYITVKIV
jgi:hypothetical protein